jgi:hypothetical protein
VFKGVGKTPYEGWHQYMGKVSKISDLRKKIVLTIKVILHVSGHVVA